MDLTRRGLFQAFAAIGAAVGLKVSEPEVYGEVVEGTIEEFEFSPFPSEGKVEIEGIIDVASCERLPVPWDDGINASLAVEGTRLPIFTGRLVPPHRLSCGNRWYVDFEAPIYTVLAAFGGFPDPGEERWIEYANGEYRVRGTIYVHKVTVAIG